MEQEEYTKEAINWSYIEFIDNQDVLDLIEKVSSIFLLCEDTLLNIHESSKFGFTNEKIRIVNHLSIRIIKVLRLLPMVHVNIEM